MTLPDFDIEFVRKQFPGLLQNFTFMDNAGGSQVLQGVIDRWVEYMTNYNVQLGASYALSAKAGELLKESTTQLAKLVHAQAYTEIILGPSTTALFRILSLCISKNWNIGDEIIITDTDHEANISCWTDLENQGFRIKVWKMNQGNFELELDELKSLLTEKTRLVAVTHCSNILGTINPIKEIAQLVHEAGALNCVDGVAFAPHREINVQEMDVDFYAYSYYKTYGPHAAVLYGKQELLVSIPGINHYFINKIPYKFQPGNFNFEMCYSLKAIPIYWENLYKRHYADEPSKDKIRLAMHLAADHEASLASRLLTYLNLHPHVQIIGAASSDKNKRVPTISFIHSKLQSDIITLKTDPHNIGIRFGDFYAKKLIQALDLEKKSGVVRVSMVHYNTLEEVDALIRVFEEIL